MPPRTAKRGAASAGTRRTPRATRGSAKSQNQHPRETNEELVKAEEVAVQVIEAKEEEQKPILEEKPVVVAEERPVNEKKTVILDQQQASYHKEEMKSDPNGLKSKLF